MKIKLFTRDGGFVHEAEIPPFNPAPEVVTWGTRIFIRSDLTSELTEPAGRYVEGIAIPLEVYERTALDALKGWQGE